VKHLRSFVAGALVTGVVLAATAASATFSATTSDTTTVTTKRVFPGIRSETAWDVRDASAGSTATNATEATSAVDARLLTSAALPISFASNRYIAVTLNSPLPSNVPTSSVALNLTFAESGGGSTCVYFEARRTSTSAVIGTHGSAISPIACNATTTQASSSTNLAEVVSSDIANDLTIRIYASNTVTQKLTLDRVTVSGTAYAAFTLFGTSITDASSGTPTTSSWALSGGAGSYYTSASAWSTAFSAARYLKLTYPAYVPSTAVVSGATFTHTYSSAATGTTCYWFEVYNAATLLASHGSTTTPQSCNSSTTFATDVVSLPEVNTAAAANNIVVKLYVRSSATGKSRHDDATIALNYSLT
jgi:hypothetical protein